LFLLLLFSLLFFFFFLFCHLRLKPFVPSERQTRNRIDNQRYTNLDGEILLLHRQDRALTAHIARLGYRGRGLQLTESTIRSILR
jgi:hypothetical protein